MTPSKFHQTHNNATFCENRSGFSTHSSTCPPLPNHFFCLSTSFGSDNRCLGNTELSDNLLRVLVDGSVSTALSMTPECTIYGRVGISLCSRSASPSMNFFKPRLYCSGPYNFNLAYSFTARAALIFFVFTNEAKADA